MNVSVLRTAFPAGPFIELVTVRGTNFSIKILGKPDEPVVENVVAGAGQYAVDVVTCGHTFLTVEVTVGTQL